MTPTPARYAGIAAQSVLLGILLTIAIFRVLAFVSNDRVFRYQGF